MPSSRFESDYLNITVGISSENHTIANLIDYINSFPEGSSRRLEVEARLFQLVAKYAAELAEYVQKTGRLTLYDND